MLFLILSSGASAGATMKICERNIALNARFVLSACAAEFRLYLRGRGSSAASKFTLCNLFFQTNRWQSVCRLGNARQQDY